MNDGVVLEPLKPLGCRLYWDDIEAGLRKFLKGDDEIAGALWAIQSGILMVWAIWIGEGQDRQVAALLFTRFVEDGFAKKHVLWLFGLYRGKARPLTMNEWASAEGQLADICRKVGVFKMMALTDNQKLISVAQDAGWNVRAYVEKEISNER